MFVVDAVLEEKTVIITITVYTVLIKSYKVNRFTPESITETSFDELG